jgi:hypothetical protein
LFPVVMWLAEYVFAMRSIMPYFGLERRTVYS